MGDGDDVVITKGSLSNADRVLILTPGGTVEQYYFHASITSSDLGWLNANDPADGSAPDRGTTLLRFFNGFVVIRSSATPVSRKLVGTVNLNPTVVPINTGVNLVSNVYPVNSITLGNSGLENFISKGSASSADRVIILDNDGTASSYYFHDSITGCSLGWLDINDLTDGSAPSKATVSIPLGSGYAVVRIGADIGVTLNPPSI